MPPRLPEWLWRGRSIRTAVARLEATAALRAERRQAQIELMLGAHAEEPSEPFAPGRDLAVATEHYRKAASAALAALTGAAAVADSAAEGQQTGAIPLRAAGGDETRLARLQAALEQPAAGFALLSAEEQPQRVAELRAFATTLTEACNADEAALERLHRQRRRRVAATVTVFAFALFRASLLLDGLDFREDLAAGKPWQTSSVAYHCEPDAKRCGDHFGMTIFFHTGEDESPWLQIDLQEDQSISAVRVRNRTDCCSLLAIPLVVELSSDGRTWREVARRNRNFRYWVPEFAPTSARWVRLRVDRKSMLHLEQVSVYR